MLIVIDEFSRECLALRVDLRLDGNEVLAELFLRQGVPEHIRSDNGPELVARAIQEWLTLLGVQTLFIKLRSPWENGSFGSFKGELPGQTPIGRLAREHP